MSSFLKPCQNCESPCRPLKLNSSQKGTLRNHVKMLRRYIKAADDENAEQECNRIHKVERYVYKCLAILDGIEAWKETPSCPFLEQYPSGRNLYGKTGMDDKEFYAFISLNWRAASTEVSPPWKQYVCSHAIMTLWYLYAKLGKNKVKAKWMLQKLKKPEEPILSSPRLHFCLHDSSVLSKRLLFQFFDNTMSSNELKYTASMSPEAVWQPGKNGGVQAMISYSIDELKNKLNKRVNSTLFFILVPVLSNDKAKPWLHDWKKRLEIELGGLLDLIRRCQHGCHLVFLFDNLGLVKQCEKTVNLLAKKLSVTFWVGIAGTDKTETVKTETDKSFSKGESPLSYLAKFNAAWEIQRTAETIKSFTGQGWSSMRLAAAKEHIGLSRGIQHGVTMMAMQILQPPSIIGSMKSQTHITVPLYEEQYTEMLRSYFNLDAMYNAFVDILDIKAAPSAPPFSKEQFKKSLMDTGHNEESGRPIKGKARAWNSHSHGKELFEPPHFDNENGYEWHQTHNAALFLQLTVAMVRYLLKMDKDAMDYERFRKDVRALTAKLNIQYKDKINRRKTKNHRNSHRKVTLKAMVRREVKRLFKPLLKKATKQARKLSANDIIEKGFRILLPKMEQPLG